MTSPWHDKGPASYFPSIEKKYGQSIAHWQEVIRTCGLTKHMEIVNHLKTVHGLGHGHANALVGWTLEGNAARLITATHRRGYAPNRPCAASDDHHQHHNPRASTPLTATATHANVNKLSAST